MGLISLIEKRGGSASDPNMWVNTLLESSNFATKSGAVITPDTALKISTVYACVTILSQTIASLPMTINQKLNDGGNRIAEEHPLFSILHDNFNSELTSYEAREMGIGHLKLRGNWYNRLEFDNRGQIAGIWPLNPSGMKIIRTKDNKIWYRYTASSDERNANELKTFNNDEIWHIKGFSKDGLTGLSTISYARESMGLSKALQDFSAEFFGRQAVPGMILKHPQNLSTAARSNIKESIDEYSKSKRFTTLILEEGLEWQNIGINNKDAQFLELSGAQIRDIARWFNVPLILLQEPDKTSTYASAEQFMLSFVVHTISPIVVRIEQSANKALLSDSERKAGYYIKINLMGLLRGDFKSRMAAFRIGRDGGWLNVDEIREFEDMPPLPNKKGKIYLQPLNYKEAGTETEPKPPAIGDKNVISQ